MVWKAAKGLAFRLLRPRDREAPADGSHGSSVPVDDPLLASGIFDADWYLFRYPEVIGFKPHPVTHFREFGFAEGRDPSPYLSLPKFLAAYPNHRHGSASVAAQQFAELSLEKEEAFLPDDPVSFEYLLTRHQLFDEQWYAANNADLVSLGVPMIKHFVEHGAAEGREPSARFDSEFYRATYPQFIERSRTAVEDFVRYGMRRGYAIAGASRYQRWVSTFDTLTDDDLERLQQKAGQLVLPTLAIHVMDAAACRHGPRVISGWRSRVDLACAVHFLRAADVDEATWRAFTAAAEAEPGLTTHADLSLFPPPSSPAVVVLVAGATVMRPHAGVTLAAVLHATACEAAYADHDHVDAAGERISPCFKPEMSPEFMRHRPYAGPMIAVAWRDDTRERILTTLAAALEGRADVAFARLLLQSRRDRVARSPFILFHDLRQPHVTENAGEAGQGDDSDRIGQTTPRLSLIIPTRDHVELLRAFLDSVERETEYPAALIDIVVVDNGSDEPETLAYLEALRARENVQVVPAPGAFNFSKLCNTGASLARGEFFVFLNNDMTVHRREWLVRLLAQACQPDVGFVGAQLLFPDLKVQHGGVVLGIQGVGAHRLTDANVGPVGVLDVTRESVAVTGACLCVRRSVFNKLGGFDPVLRVAFNDVKLCVAAHEAGMRNIYIGEPLLLHHESQSRGFDDAPHKRRINARESIYVRERHGDVFRNDPFYSPNLSLQAVDRLATPPRVVRPWRRSRANTRRALLLCLYHGIGYGVAVVVQQQAACLRERGWEVIVGGPLRPREVAYEGCERVDLWTAEAAAAFAVAAAVDIVISHTDPFFSLARFLGASPLLYFTDHGEPPPHLFEDRLEREALDWEKRFCAPMARRVFVISKAVEASQFRTDAVVIRNGNSHLACWSSAWEERRLSVRRRLGLENRFVVLNVCRFGAKDRIYKGVDRYAEVAQELQFSQPDLADQATFILAGRGNAKDVAEMSLLGIDVHANPSDADLVDLYAASDLYMSFSQWEGYNLGIGQALAMGLDVIASDIPAHREFGIMTSDNVRDVCAAVERRIAALGGQQRRRQAVVEPWSVPLLEMTDLIEADLQGSRRHETLSGARWC